MKKQSPAELVINMFGGVRSLARELGIHASTVSRWKMGEGTVPQKYWKSLISLAKEGGKKITIVDLSGISEKIS